MKKQVYGIGLLSTLSCLSLACDPGGAARDSNGETQESPSSSSEEEALDPFQVGDRPPLVDDEFTVAPEEGQVAWTQVDGAPELDLKPVTHWSRPSAERTVLADSAPKGNGDDVGFASTLANVPADGTAPLALGENPEWNDNLGTSVAIGDFNDDGVDDFVVGAPLESRQGRRASGAFLLWEGSPTSAPAPQMLGEDTTGEFGQFGWSMAVGDFNGDEIDDLAVSAPYDSSLSGERGGAVFIYRGSNSGLTYVQRIDQESLGLGTNRRGDQFGWALAAGDFDDDGVSDLAIGAPGDRNGYEPQTGAVYLAKGVDGGNLTAMEVVVPNVLDTPDRFERFGAALASGANLYPNSYPSAGDTLIVGAFNDFVDGRRSGAVYTFRGTGLSMYAVERLTPTTLHDANDDFGWSLAIGDFDGVDGHPDLAVGSPGAERDTGYVYVYKSNGWGLNWPTVYSGEAYDNLPGARYGESLAAGDINADGLADLLVGAPGTAYPDSETGSPDPVPDVGVIGVLFGAPSGLQDGGYNVRQSNSWTREKGERFGSAIAVGTRGSKFGSNHILTSSPFERVGGTDRAGAAFVYWWFNSWQIAISFARLSQG